MSERGLQELHRQGLIGNGALEKLDFCEHYVYGKHKRVKFPTAIHSLKAMLDYVHSDIWGKIPHNLHT